jgi:hypothetical protein
MKKAVLGVGILLCFILAAPAMAGEALCFNCGELHYGVLNQCDKCGFKPDTDNFQLWLTFSDQFLPVPILKQFGDVTKKIKGASNDFEERLWVFFQYLVDKYPEAGIIDPKSVKIPDKYKQSVPKILKDLDLPVINIPRQ